MAYCSGYSEFREKCCKCNGGSQTVIGIGYEKITSGTCEASGNVPITTKEECESAAQELGLLDDAAATASIGGQPEGCYWNDGNLPHDSKMVTMATSDSAGVQKNSVCGG